jgi:electron transfer flavoprotein beta subunit
VLRIIALVKYVPEATGRRFADDLTVDRISISGRLQELDEYTAEQAIRLAEARWADGSLDALNSLGES